MAQKFLTYSEVDTAVQNKMSNRVPDSTRRLEALNDFIQELFATYDITPTRRKATISVVPDGTAYDVSSLVTDDDVKAIKTLKYVDNDDNLMEFNEVDCDVLDEHINHARYLNEYALYFEDATQYFKVNSLDNFDTAQSMELYYYSYFVSYNSLTSTFKELVESEEGSLILLPKRFKNVLVWGTMRELLYPAIGDDAERRYAIVTNKLKSEINKLGIDYTGKKRKSKKLSVKLYNQT